MNYNTFNLTIMAEKFGIAPTGGSGYVRTYSGGLKIIELILSAAIIFFLIICGHSIKTYFLFGLSIFSLLSSGIVMILYFMNYVKGFANTWFWVEFGYCLTIGILYTLASTVVMTIFTKAYIATSAIGYVAAVVYLTDTLDKFKIAVEPRARYVWTTPNLPE